MFHISSPIEYDIAKKKIAELVVALVLGLALAYVFINFIDDDMLMLLLFYYILYRLLW